MKNLELTMGKGYLCIEYSESRKGKALEEPHIHELKSISVNKSTKGTHFFTYTIDKKQYWIYFMPDGLDIIVVDDISDKKSEARRIYATELDALNTEIGAAIQNKQKIDDERIKIADELIELQEKTIKSLQEIIDISSENSHLQSTLIELHEKTIQTLEELIDPNTTRLH